MRLVPLTGFPRSGSTLLMSVLDQNPLFEIGDDSELGNLIFQTLSFVRDNIGHMQLNHEIVKKSVINYCNAGANAWIDTICPPDKIFIDKERHWTNFLDLYFNVIEDTKVIFILRDLRGIVNSFEKIRVNSLYYNKETEEHSVSNELITTQRAMATLALPYVESAILSCKIIKETNFSHKDKIYFCRYEDLIQDPDNELNKIYEFLNINTFNHDFNNITQKGYNDNPYQPWGNHKIQSEIKYRKENYEYLNQQTQDFIVRSYQWFYDLFYPEVK